MDATGSERKIWQAAEQLVSRFGRDAPKQAERRAVELELRHRSASAKTWRRIGQRAREALARRGLC